MAAIAFIYIEEPFFVYHSVGLAIELDKRKGHAISIFYNYKNESILKEVLPENHGIKLIKVSPIWIIPLPVYFEIKLAHHKSIYKRYKKQFASQDIIVSNMYADLNIKEVIAPKKNLMVYTSHGIANRKYSFNDIVKKYDFILCSSHKEVEYRRKKGQIDSNNYCVGGYLKLDIANPDKEKIFSNDNEIVLYNPHWDKNLTSFYEYGFEILDYFKDHPNINLIFAPHSLLTKRNMLLRWRLKNYQKYRNIHIDFGSKKSLNFSYLQNADIYLGDVSSQALEFCLFGLRKCIFIDVNNKKDMEYISWKLGPVFSDGFSMEYALSEVAKTYDDSFKEEQKRVLDEAFTIPKNNTSTEVFTDCLLTFIESKIGGKNL